MLSVFLGLSHPTAPGVVSKALPFTSVLQSPAQATFGPGLASVGPLESSWEAVGWTKQRPAAEESL